MLKKLIPFFLFPIFVFGQPQRVTFSKSEISFFHERTEVYQRWLDQTGLGKVLKTDGLEITKKNTAVELWLTFKTCDPDTAKAMWKQLQSEYPVSAGRNIANELFQKMVQFMEIPPHQGNVQIYLHGQGGGLLRCFYIFLWNNGDDFKTDVHIDSCQNKFKVFDVGLPPLILKKTNKGKTSITTRNFTSTEVFNRIIQYAHARYEKQEDGRYPKVVKEKRNDQQLTFIVEDLSREVLTGEKKSLWCEIMVKLDIQCNDITRERLEFDFRYNPQNRQLTCTLVGKFGSGVYYPRHDSWMDMEPDFEFYLQQYTDKLSEAIKKEFEKP